jgi:hypothetical protein
MTDQTKIPAPEPVAQVQLMGSFQGVPHYGCLLTMAAERRMKVNDPLYGSAELETYAAAREAAARHEERESIAVACENFSADLVDRSLSEALKDMAALIRAIRAG